MYFPLNNSDFYLILIFVFFFICVLLKIPPLNEGKLPEAVDPNNCANISGLLIAIWRIFGGPKFWTSPIGFGGFIELFRVIAEMLEF